MPYPRDPKTGAILPAFTTKHPHAAELRDIALNFTHGCVNRIVEIRVDETLSEIGKQQQCMVAIARTIVLLRLTHGRIARAISRMTNAGTSASQ